MAPSNAKRGAYYKARTRRWLEKQGYQVFDMEVVRWIQRGNIRIPVKHDQCGADLGAMSATELVFVQVKSGNVNGNFPSARRKFAEFTFPPFVRRCVVAWARRARQPRVVDCNKPD